MIEEGDGALKVLITVTVQNLGSIMGINRLAICGITIEDQTMTISGKRGNSPFIELIAMNLQGSQQSTLQEIF